MQVNLFINVQGGKTSKANILSKMLTKNEFSLNSVYKIMVITFVGITASREYLAQIYEHDMLSDKNTIWINQARPLNDNECIKRVPEMFVSKCMGENCIKTKYHLNFM